MDDANRSHGAEHGVSGWLMSRTGIAMFVALAVLGFLIYWGHTAHLLGLLPYLLFLACPLMHLFMHGGRGAHHAQADTRDIKMTSDGEPVEASAGRGCCGARKPRAQPERKSENAQ